ncbi:MAG: hypothetical protein QOC87_1568 [Actinomycetota bacterium]|nr:hypothetical protein [Actinomycetota bacterium]
MDDQSFAPGTPEAELNNQVTVLMAGGPLKNKRGHAILTNDRVLFFDQRFNAQQSAAVGGILAGLLAQGLEKARGTKPPIVDMPLTDIAHVSHVTKMTVRDILVIEGPNGTIQFAQGYKTWEPLLRRALTERHDRTIVEDGSGSWKVTGG